MPVNAAGRPSDDAGLTVIEMAVSTALLMLVLAISFSAMISLQNTDRRVQALVANEQDARFVVNELVRDIRQANPLVDFSTTSTAYETQIEMKAGPVAAPTSWIRWVYNTNAASPQYRTLRRETLNSTGTAVLTTQLKLRNIRNIDSGVKMFVYTGESGQDLVAMNAGADVGRCAIHVEVTVTADSNPGPEPFTIRSDAEIRNRLPGGVGCG